MGGQRDNVNQGCCWDRHCHSEQQYFEGEVQMDFGGWMQAKAPERVYDPITEVPVVPESSHPEA